MQTVTSIFAALNSDVPLAESAGLAVTCPGDGALLATLKIDAAACLAEKILCTETAQRRWKQLARGDRQALLETLAAAVKTHRESLARLITLEGGKTAREALGEADGSADVIIKTCKDAALADFGGMSRCKERPPVGLVGLITSFNFPLAVANWTIAPALLAANGVLWKPSEKTPLTALAYKAIFDSAMGDYADLLQILIGGREIGSAMVAHESVDMISATGSVAMGKGIKAALAKKNNNEVKPILELGGNNGVIISDKLSAEHLEWSLGALLNSFLGTSGQRCTNTRRVIVQRGIYDKAAAILEKRLREFVSDPVQTPLGGVSNEFGYGPLIDADAYTRFEQAKASVLAGGGSIVMGGRLHEKQWPGAYYVEPALALLPTQVEIMHEETFAPLLYLVPYDSFDEAIALLNAPDNAGLVNGIYTQSQKEADRFARENQAGHSVINSAKGTGTPAFGMGFGGNKASGEGEILNASDPLRAFTRDTAYHRIAQNADIKMDRD